MGLEGIIGAADDDFPVGAMAMFADVDAEPCQANDYDPIATVFDTVMADDFHAVTHHMREQVAASVARTDAIRCLDLCCGTGLFFELLAPRFHLDGVGLDRSRGQILVAEARSHLARASLRYSVGDVREVMFPSDVDLATINFDALNHLGSREQWRDVLGRACASLRVGGKLLIDVNLPARLANDWDSPEVIVKPEVVYIQLARPPIFEDGGVRRQTPIVLFLRGNDGRFVKRHMLIEQFAIPLEGLCELLRACGFSHLEMLQESTPNPQGHIFNKNRAFLAATR